VRTLRIFFLTVNFHDKFTSRKCEKKRSEFEVIYHLRYNRSRPSAAVNCNTLHYTVFREESKQDSDMDEPWIMTVKGPHGVKGSVVPMLPLDEQPASLTITHTNHRSSNHSQPSKPHANGASRSPPKDSTLNHYRSESRDSRDGQPKHTPVHVYSNNQLLLREHFGFHIN
jgi:hypothetical protein